MTIREQVLHDALALPPEDRAFVVERLDESLNQGDFALPEIASAWTAEIDRRIAAYERGQVQAVDADTSVDRMRQYLAEHRSRKANS
jgi:putative addiction module component (TIGR02574 family)